MKESLFFLPNGDSINAIIMSSYAHLFLGYLFVIRGEGGRGGGSQLRYDGNDLPLPPSFFLLFLQRINRLAS